MLQASSANIEKARTLTWEEAIKAGEKPMTPADSSDDSSTYGMEVPNDQADIHQLAMDARRKREDVSNRQKAWNRAVQVGS